MTNSSAKNKPTPVIFWMTCLYAGGIGLEHTGLFSFVFVSVITFCILIAAYFLIKKTRLFTLTVLLLFMCVGFIHARSFKTLPKEHIVYRAKYYLGKEVVLRGKIISNVEQRRWGKTKKFMYLLKLNAVQSPWGFKKTGGLVLVNNFHPQELFYGDHVELTGKLHKAFDFESEGHFSYPAYLRTKNIYYILSVKKTNPPRVLHKDYPRSLKRFLYTIRQRLQDKLAIFFSDQEAAIMEAALLGERGGISPTINQIFEQTGTVHILAISGLNIGVVSGVIFLILSIFPIRRSSRIILTIGILLAYAVLTGGSPSVVRAALMTSVFLLSFILEKENDQFNSWALAAFILLFINPGNFFDIGFQLSFVCVGAIIFFAPFLKVLKQNHAPASEEAGLSRWIGWVILSIEESVIISLAVWVFVAGLVVYYFGIVTPITIVANIFIVPLMCACVGLGMGFLLAAFAWPWLAYLFSMVIKCLLNVMVGLAFLFSKVPLAYFYLKNINIWGIIIYYVLVIFLTIYFYRLKSKLPNPSPQVKQNLLEESMG